MINWNHLLAVIFSAVTTVAAMRVVKSSSLYGNSTSINVISLFLNNYTERHSYNSVLKDENLCSRKFLIGTYSCPHRAGNILHDFLNSFIVALVTDRTFVWEPCERRNCFIDESLPCDRYLKRHDWLPSFFQIKSMLNSFSCNTTEDILVDSRLRHLSTIILACCGVDGINSTFLRIGSMEGHEAVSLSILNALFTTHSSRVAASLLFPSDLLEDVTYGLLFRLCFSFTDYVVQKNDATLRLALSNNSKYSSKQNVSNFYFFGIHLRHSESNDHGGDGHGERECINKMMTNTFYNTPFSESMRSNTPSSKPLPQCVFLAASDRLLGLNRLQVLADVHKCIFIISNHTEARHTAGEHGPYTGEIAMLDLELLSRSDILLGSSYWGIYSDKSHYGLMSTYSVLASSLKHTNGRYEALITPSIYLVQPTGVKRRRGIILCEPRNQSRRMSNYNPVFSSRPLYTCNNDSIDYLQKSCPFSAAIIS